MSASQSPDGFDEDLSDFDDFESIQPAAKRTKKGKAGGASSNGNGNSKSKAKGQAGSSNNNSMQDEGPDVASARKLQNRVAQREFRQRKLQYVKDLEARVEFLSSSKDDQLEALKAMLRGLLDENKQLRTLLQNVTSFVGEGAGGLSSKVGLKDYNDVDSFMEFVGRGERDTLITIYDDWKERKANGGDAVADLDTPELTQSPAPTSTAKSKSTKAATGRSSQPTSRASSPANATSGSATEGLSRKRSRNDKLASTQLQSQAQAQPSVARSAPTPPLQQNAKGNAQSANVSPAHAVPASVPSDLKSGSSIGPSPPGAANTSSYNNLSGTYPDPSAQPWMGFANYPSTMSAGTSSGQTGPGAFNAPGFYAPSFGNGNSRGNSVNPYLGNAQGMSSGLNMGNSDGASAFFFDTAEPMSMPTSNFTNEFLNEYIHTGLTPLIDPSYQGNLFPWATNSVDLPQGAPTPSSSTSSMHQMPSPVNVNLATSSSTGQSATGLSQGPPQQTGAGFVPQLSLLQNQMQQHQHQQQQQQQFQAQRQAGQMNPNQGYNPQMQSSPRSLLPSIPPGFSPDELINSNPLLAALHIISYHLRNKAANASYVLPPSLEPTPVQLATPHDTRLDGILHKEWRSRLISQVDYNINELLADLMQSVTVHPGDNLLEPGNWEVSETFLQKYRHTLTQDVLRDVNKWRRERGEKEFAS